MNEPTTTPIPAEFLGAPLKDGATYKQLNFLDSLAVEREITEGAREQLIARIAAQKLANSNDGEGTPCEGGISKSRASDWISRLLDKPKLAKQTTINYDTPGGVPTPEELPAGRYAVDNADGELRFYHVWRGTRRPEYVKLYLQHGQDSTEVPFKAALTILQKIIDAGAYDCAVKYGTEIGACSVCNRRLTNRLSRELGIGPICGGRYWEDDEGHFSDLKESAREAIIARGEDPAGNVDPYEYDERIDGPIHPEDPHQ